MRIPLAPLLVLAAFAVASCDGATSGSISPGPGGALSFAWPPVAGEAYPDLELLDHRGNVVRLSDFTGKVVLVEAIGMT